MSDRRVILFAKTGQSHCTTENVIANGIDRHFWVTAIALNEENGHVFSVELLTDKNKNEINSNQQLVSSDTFEGLADAVRASTNNGFRPHGPVNFGRWGNPQQLMQREP